MGWSDVPKDALAFRLSSMHSGPESSLAAMEVELTASKVSDEVETQGAPVMHGMGLGLGLELRLAENLAQGPWQWHAPHDPWTKSTPLTSPSTYHRQTQTSIILSYLIYICVSILICPYLEQLGGPPPVSSSRLRQTQSFGVHHNDGRIASTPSSLDH